jgi:hypothetical protein
VGTQSTAQEGRPSSRQLARWVRIDKLRKAAGLSLEAIGAEFGQGSVIHRQCEAVWHRAEEGAVTSLLHADFENAATLLDRALDVLSRAPEVARRAELSADDLALLLGSM